MIEDSQSMLFRSAAVSAQWDTWMVFHEGTSSLYYLITKHSPGEGFGLATSPDGVTWSDHGRVVRASDRMVKYLGHGRGLKGGRLRAKRTLHLQLLGVARRRDRRGDAEHPVRLERGPGSLDEIRRRAGVQGRYPLVRPDSCFALGSLRVFGSPSLRGPRRLAIPAPHADPPRYCRRGTRYPMMAVMV